MIFLRGEGGQVLQYNKSYIIFAVLPGHYGYNFQEQFITSLPEEILYTRSFLILKKLGGDMKSDIARSDPLNVSDLCCLHSQVQAGKEKRSVKVVAGKRQSL
jgi:hypothetical protein